MASRRVSGPDGVSECGASPRVLRRTAAGGVGVRALGLSLLVHVGVLFVPGVLLSRIDRASFGGGERGTAARPFPVSFLVPSGATVRSSSKAPPRPLSPPAEVPAPELRFEDPFAGHLPALRGKATAAPVAWSAAPSATESPASDDGSGAAASTAPEASSEAGAAGTKDAAVARGGGAPRRTGDGPAPRDGRLIAPRLLVGALPFSEREARALGAPPEIAVRLLVGTDGRVVRVEPADPSIPAPVVDAVIRSTEVMRFVPARRDGRAVEAWFSMAFVFRK